MQNYEIKLNCKKMRFKVLANPQNHTNFVAYFKKPTELTMIQNNIKTKVVGVDIGIEKTTYAVVDVRGNIIARDSFPTTESANLNIFIATLCDRIIEMIEKNGGYEQIRSLGVSAPNGNFLRGAVVNAGNLPWKGELPLAAMMRDRLGLAVAVGNDAHVRALGEWVYGCAHGMQNFLLISLGHGFGSCLFSNGHPHLGNNGFAGEIGHCCLYSNGRQCTCGSNGCLEAYCAANGIVETAREVMAESSKPSLMREVAQLDPKIIHQFCDQGDELAIETYRRTGFILGLALANYASVVNPEMIILTGGIALAGKWLLEPTNDAFEEHVFHNVAGKINIVTSTLNGEERDLLGAGALAWRVKEYSLFK